jgi:Zn-dependent protease/predicted transcriptional regulator
MARKGFFGNQLTLFRLFGFTVRLDASWIFIALLVTWTLAAGFFPLRRPDLAPVTYWLMGIFGAFGLFASIVFHEFWHSLVARRYGLPMKGITLFIFGGMAEMDAEPQRPGAEFAMAIAGPIASVVIGTFFYLLYAWGRDVWGVAAEVLWYLAFINWVLAVFNMVPAFPLDGGRILRSALWRWKGDLRWATHQAARFGSGFGLLLVALGFINVLIGNLVGGFWYVILGLFLRSAAQMSYQQVLLRESFEDVPVRRLMKKEPIIVSPDISLRELVEEHIYVHHFKMFPVVEKDRLLGCVTTRAVKEIPRDEWEIRTVRSVVGTCADGQTVEPEVPVAEALAIMNQHGLSRLMVVRDGRLQGIISLKDILGALSARQELEP